eukprot:1153223-Pelagomonas_calceolata.AAC.9
MARLGYKGRPCTPCVGAPSSSSRSSSLFETCTGWAQMRRSPSSRPPSLSPTSKIALPWLQFGEHRILSI